ncbi:hypothetical protein C1645_763778 [Glomus cerebriforme]|uniref:Uncharacterized protein n=1 Tax=Glomus cerebriforme TaxID=658196 RepID=A0A397T9C0_9GLOM|nr:hypothetical protein C1645_763778 [Glomus cerebriforme]
MSSAKRPYNETISSNSSTSTALSDNNDYIVNVVVEEEQKEVGQDMDIEEQTDSFKNRQTEEESRRKRIITDNDLFRSNTFTQNPFPSLLNDHSFHSSSLTQTSRSTLNYSLSNKTSNAPYFIVPSSRIPASTYHPLSNNVESNYISPRDSLNNNTHNINFPKSTLKISENTEALSPIDLLMSSPPISTSTPKTNRTKNTSNSSLTLTTQDSNTWNNADFNCSSPRDTASNLRDQTNVNTNSLNYSSAEGSSYLHDSYSNINDDSSDDDNININGFNNDNINNNYSKNDNISNNSSNNNNINNFDSSNIRTRLTKKESKGPFELIYSQIYDEEGIVFATESFNYLIQLYEFCDNNSTKLQSNITSILRDLVLLLNSQLDGFDIPFIEHHKWNGSHFYGPIDVLTLLDHLDDGLGLSSAEYIIYVRNYKNNYHIKPGGSVLQCGYRRTYRRNYAQSSSSPASFPTSSFRTSDQSNNNIDNIQNNELRHAVLDEDAVKEAQNFLELLAEEEDGEEDNSTEQEEESDSFIEISKESDYEDDDSLVRGFSSTSIRQPTDTFGNPINQTRTTTRRISRPSVNNDGSETDDSLDDYSVDSGESTFEEIDFSDIESVATDSTVEDGWHNVSRD